MPTSITILSIVIPLIYTIFYSLGLNMNPTIITDASLCDPSRVNVSPICNLELVDCEDYNEFDEPNICNTKVSWVTNCANNNNLRWFWSGLTLHIIGNICYFILIVWRLRNIYNNLLDIIQNNSCGSLIKCSLFSVFLIGLGTCLAWVGANFFCVGRNTWQNGIHGVFAAFAVLKCSYMDQITIGIINAAITARRITVLAALPFSGEHI
eukprot:206179_1